MSELRRIVDEIRFILQDSSGPRTDHLLDYASEYAAGCREVNARLRKCEEFLNQGLRSEALHFADLDPNLLDLVGLLDFPELNEWNELVAQYSLAKPEPLLWDVAVTLNEAYALQEPVQRLLGQHRLHALARSPLSQRLKVLRSLYDVDHASGHWEADVREMERVRFREIETESRAAAAKGDVDRLKVLYSELTNGPWLETIPPNLLRDLKQRGSGVNRAQARQQLEYLVELLHGAHASMDLAIGRQMRDAWQENARIVQLPANDILAEQVAPILAWIEDEDRKDTEEKAYRSAVFNLEQALDDDSLEASVLQQLGNSVERHGRGIPDRLRMRFRSRLGNLTFSETRRKRLRIAGMAGALLAFAGVIVAGVYYANMAEKSRQLLAAVEDLIEEHRLDEAKELLEEFSPDSFSADGLDVKKKLADATQAEHDRQIQLAAALEGARNAKDSTQSEVALKQARALARSTEEKVAIGKLESEWEERRNATVAKTEQQFRELVASTTNQLVELDRLLLTPNSDPAIQRLSGDIEKALSAMHSLEANVAPESASQGKLLDSRFAAIQKTQAEKRKKNSLLANLARLTLILPSDEAAEIHLSEYREALTQFAQAFPADVRSKGFQNAGNADVIQATFIRQKRIAAWKRFWPADAADIETRNQECSQLLTDYPSTPDREFIEFYQLFLKSLRWRENGDDESDQSVKSRMRTLFSGKLVKEGHMLRTTNGACYYLEKEKDLTGNEKVNFKYLIGFNGETEQAKDLDVATLVSPKTAPPPQCRIANRVWDTVSDIKPETWDTYMKDLSVSLLAAQDIDPFLRYFLLLRTLEFSSQGNSFLARELQSCLKELSDSQMDLTVSWMNPKDATARTARQLAVVLIRHATGIEEAWKRAAMAQEKLAENLFRECWPMGWIERGKDHRWILRSDWSVDQQHTLICAGGSADGTKRQWQEIGTFQGASADLRVPANSGLLEGTVVFATRQPKGVLSTSRR